MTDSETPTKRLKVGLPKGSLQEATLKYLAKAGFIFSVGSRSYFPTVDDDEIEAILLRAQEIARYVEDGVFDIGFTGLDWIRETRSDVIEVADLGYAKATLRPVRWVLAVPEHSPIRSIHDLEGKRIATEVVNLTREYLEAKGIHAEVEFSWGATEVKTPALVDAIVDATETGSSLREHKLRVIDTVMTSTTRLIANKQSWQDPWKREKIETIVLLLQGALAAETRVGLKMNVARKDLDVLVRNLPAMKNPTVSPLYDERYVAVEIVVEEKAVRTLIPKLKKWGAMDIIEYPLNKVIP